MRYDPIPLCNLLLGRETEVIKDALVQADPLPHTVVAPVLHRVDVVDEVGRVAVIQVIEPATGTDFLDGETRGFS